MTDFANKIIAIFLIVCMLLLAPLVIQRKADRVLNIQKAINAMELFLDTCSDAHLLDINAYNRLVLQLEACDMTCSINIKIKNVTIADDKTYLWTTANVTDLSTSIQLDLGDIIELNVCEQTLSRTHDIWAAIFRTKSSMFDETLLKTVK